MLSVLSGHLSCLTIYFLSPWEVCGELVLAFMPHAEEEMARFSDFLKASVRTLYISDLMIFIAVFKA